MGLDVDTGGYRVLGMRMTERRARRRWNYDGSNRVVNGGECKTVAVVWGGDYGCMVNCSTRSCLLPLLK